MYFKDLIESMSRENEILLIVDMDGVIADYEFGCNIDFKNKRPIKTNIKLFKKIDELPNVKLCTIGIARQTDQIEDKHIWLDKHAPFIKNRTIDSKENNLGLSGAEIKLKMIRKILRKTDKTVVMVDDDNETLKFLKDKLKDNIILFQVSSILD